MNYLIINDLHIFINLQQMTCHLCSHYDVDVPSMCPPDGRGQLLFVLTCTLIYLLHLVTPAAPKPLWQEEAGLFLFFSCCSCEG